MYDLEDWVTTFIGCVVERLVDGDSRWCASWYDHPEAVARLWVLFNSYRESARHGDATDQARWYIDVLDPHLEALLSPRGPYARCTPAHHVPPSPVPVQRAPAGTWGPRLRDVMSGSAAGGGPRRD